MVHGHGMGMQWNGQPALLMHSLRFLIVLCYYFVLSIPLHRTGVLGILRCIWVVWRLSWIVASISQ